MQRLLAVRDRPAIDCLQHRWFEHEGAVGVDQRHGVKCEKVVQRRLVEPGVQRDQRYRAGDHALDRRIRGHAVMVGGSAGGRITQKSR